MSSHDVTVEIRDTLAWMVADMNHRREQTGLDGDVKSPEMRMAEQLLDDLRAGRIECRRLDAGSEVEP